MKKVCICAFLVTLITLLCTLGTPMAAGARVFHVPGDFASIEEVSRVATADDVVVVQDMAMAKEARRYGNRFRIRIDPSQNTFAAPKSELLGSPKAIDKRGQHGQSGRVIAGTPEKSLTSRSAGAGKVIHVPGNYATLPDALHSAKEGDTLVIHDPGMMKDAARFRGRFDIRFAPQQIKQEKTTVNSRSAVPAGVPATGSISGNISDGSSPLQHIRVDILNANTHRLKGWALSNTNGDYQVGGLGGTNYIVGFADNAGNNYYATEWYDDKITSWAADQIWVDDGLDKPNINAVLNQGGSISGTVTDGANPLGGIRVGVYGTDGWDMVAMAWTDGSGTYIVNGLKAGDYKVEFQDPSGTFISQYYNNQFSFFDADAVAVVSSADTSDIDAVLELSGTISGTVTDGTNPLAGINVNIVDANCSYVGYGYTDATGFFQSNALRAGSYHVQYEDMNFVYAREWYNNKSDCQSADFVDVLAGSETPNVNAALEVGGSISGTVTDSGANPLPNITVEVYDQNNNWMSWIWTDMNGHYSAGGLPSGSYRVNFNDWNETYFAEWYNNQASFNTADPVAVTLGADTPNIDAVLELGGSISGTVTDSGASPLPNIYVAVHDQNNNSVGGTWTDANGQYSAGRLPSGTYRVKFNDWNGTYLAEWYNNQASFNTADPVVVALGVDTPNIDSVLAVGGSISGTVTDDSANPLPNIDVNVYDQHNNWMSGAQTNVNGQYSAGGLPAGSYKVHFANDGKYLAEWYNNQSSFGAADPVAVALGADTPKIDAALELGGSISGTVTDDSANPLPNIYVEVYDQHNNWPSWAQTNTNGDYQVGGLPTGSYKVNFANGDGTYVAEWYNNQASFNAADPVEVTLGADTPNIDAVLDVGGSISGTVTDSGTNPLQDIRVTVYDQNNIQVHWAWTDLNGQYSAGGLPSGSYRVNFANGNGTYVAEWYNNQASFNAADPVTVTIGTDTPNIDAVLDVGGSISGTVTDSGAKPLQYISIEVYDQNNNSVSWAWTDANGQYSAGGLPSGSHRVKFNDWNGTYVAEWYNNQASFNAADPVAVTLGADTPNIDAVLDVGGSISGIVTDDGANPLQNIDVIVYDQNNNWLSWVWTDVNGQYSAGGLPSGSYRVNFSDWQGIYNAEWYNNQASFNAADPVAVILGAETPNIDAVLGMHQLQYTVTPSAGTGGSLSPATPQGVNHNDTTAFTVTADAGYGVATVTGCGGSLAGSVYTTGPITADCTVTATFTLNQYTVTPSAGTGGSLSPATPQGVNHNDTMAFTVTADAGYGVATVTGCGGSLAGSVYTTGPITADCTVTATFTLNQYTVTPSAGTGGSLSPATPQAVNHNDTTAFTVTADAGYGVATVTGCGGSLAGSVYTTGPITADCTVTATFTLNQYTVTPSAGTGGSLSPATPQAVNHNDTTAFTVTADAGYGVATVTGCGGSLAGSVYTTGPITADCTVTATFTLNQYTVTPSAGTGGSLSPATPQGVNHNDTTAFTVAADAGYGVATVTGCGGSLAGSVYTTGPITADCTVTATFTPDTFTLTVTLDGTGYGSVTSFDNGIDCGTDCTENYSGGTTVKLTAKPSLRSFFTGWSGDCNSDGEVTMNADMSCTVSFSAAGDWNADGSPDMVWHNPVSGMNALLYLKENEKAGIDFIVSAPAEWEVISAADLDEDGFQDLIFHNTKTGVYVVAYFEGKVYRNFEAIPFKGAPWELCGTADLNGDDRADLFWTNTATGENEVVYLSAGVASGSDTLPTAPPPWKVVAVDDFNGDDVPDLLARNTETGVLAAGYLNGTNLKGIGILPVVPLSQEICGTMDLDLDGRPDLVMRDSVTGKNEAWYMDGTKRKGDPVKLPTAPSPWSAITGYK